MVFIFVGIIQCISWIARGLYRLHNDPGDIFGGLLPFLVAIAWLYTKIRPIPIPSPPRPIFYLLVLCRIGGISTIMSSVFHGLPQ